MKCSLCDRQRRRTEMLVHKDDPTESRGILCSRCRNQLLRQAETSRQCGYQGCRKTGSFGTQTLKRLHSSGSAFSTESVRVFDQFLLCPEHYNEMISN